MVQTTLNVTATRRPSKPGPSPQGPEDEDAEEEDKNEEEDSAPRQQPQVQAPQRQLPNKRLRNMVAMDVDSAPAHRTPRSPSPPSKDVVVDTTRSRWSQPRNTPREPSKSVKPPSPVNLDSTSQYSNPKSDDEREMDKETRKKEWTSKRADSPIVIDEPLEVPPNTASSSKRPRSPPFLPTPSATGTTNARKRPAAPSLVGPSSRSGRRVTSPDLEEMRPAKKRQVSLAAFAMPGSQVAGAASMQASEGGMEKGSDGDDDDEIVEEEHEDREEEGKRTDDNANVRHRMVRMEDHRTDDEEGTSMVETQLLEDQSSSLNASQQMSSSDKLLEVIKQSDASVDISVHIDLARMRRLWSQPHRTRSTASRNSIVQGAQAAHVPSEAGLLASTSNERANEALARVIEKSDFEGMEVLGQFNLGFIICRRVKSMGVDGHMDDLFIVDQHAADEKYNFETLQATTRIHAQKLIQCVFFSLPV